MIVLYNQLCFYRIWKTFYHLSSCLVELWNLVLVELIKLVQYFFEFMFLVQLLNNDLVFEYLLLDVLAVFVELVPEHLDLNSFFDFSFLLIELFNSLDYLVVFLDHGLVVFIDLVHYFLVEMDIIILIIIRLHIGSYK